MEKELDSGIPVKIITYREEHFETREIDCGKHGFVTVAKKDLWEALREGFNYGDCIAFEIAEGIADYCTEEEFELSDQELCRLIYG